MYRLIFTLIMSGAFLSACGSGAVGPEGESQEELEGPEELVRIAAETCDELDGQIMLTAGATLAAAVSEAEGKSYTGLELGDAMHEQCPGIMQQIDDFVSEREAREALPGQMELVVTACRTASGVSRGTTANGRVTNHAAIPVDIFIEVDFLNSRGIVLDQGIDSVSYLRPGETARWEATAFTPSSECRARVSSVFEQ